MVQNFWDIQPIKIFCIILIVKIKIPTRLIFIKYQWMVFMLTWSFLRSFCSTTMTVASIHWSILVAVACTLFMEVFTRRNKIRMESGKIFERCLLCSSQFTSTQRIIRKFCQFIPFKFLLNKVNLCLFSWILDDMYLRKKKIKKIRC